MTPFNLLSLSTPILFLFLSSTLMLIKNYIYLLFLIFHLQFSFGPTACRFVPPYHSCQSHQWLPVAKTMVNSQSSFYLTFLFNLHISFRVSKSSVRDLDTIINYADDTHIDRLRPGLWFPDPHTQLSLNLILWMPMGQLKFRKHKTEVLTFQPPKILRVFTSAIKAISFFH